MGPTARLKEIASELGVNTAILAITHDRPAALISRILEARLQGLTILEMPTVYEGLTRRVPVEHIYDQWLLFTDGFYLVSKEYVQKVKRLTDFWVSALLLIGTLPITALSALAIRLDSPGPIFFKQ